MPFLLGSLSHDVLMDEPLERLVMRAEIGAESNVDERGVMVSLDSLPLRRELQAALTSWAEVGWEGDDARIDEEGRRLYLQVVEALKPTEVVWDND